MMLAIILGVIFLGAPNRDAQAQDDDKTAYPERLAGYDVLNVRDADNTQCYSKPEPMFVVKMAETSIDNLMSSNDFDLDDIKEAIVAAGHPENSGIILAGPSATKAKELEKHSDWNDLRSERGCVKFGNKTNREHSHNRTDGVPTPNTFYHYEPGLAVIVDDEIAYNSNHNAQSVDLIAPTVGGGDFATQKSPDRRPEWFITVTESVFRFYPFLTPASSTDYPSRCLEIHAGA